MNTGYSRTPDWKQMRCHDSFLLIANLRVYPTYLTARSGKVRRIMDVPTQIGVGLINLDGCIAKNGCLISILVACPEVLPRRGGPSAGMRS